MVSVILGSWRDLEGDDVGQVFALGLGVMSVSTVWIAFFVIRSSIARPSSNAVAAAPGPMSGSQLGHATP
jgi:hypothetical protein